MSEPGSPERPAPDTEAMESSPGTDQGDTPKKGRKKKGEKKPIPKMKLTVDVQQWLRQENGKAVKVKIADLRVDKTKERGQIRSINYDDVARKVTGYQALPPAGPLRVTAWEDSGMTRVRSKTFLLFASVHGLLCRWLTLRSEWSAWHRNMQKDSGTASRRRQRIGGLAGVLLR